MRIIPLEQWTTFISLTHPPKNMAPPWDDYYSQCQSRHFADILKANNGLQGDILYKFFTLSVCKCKLVQVHVYIITSRYTPVPDSAPLLIEWEHTRQVSVAAKQTQRGPNWWSVYWQKATFLVGTNRTLLLAVDKTCSLRLEWATENTSAKKFYLPSKNLPQYFSNCNRRNSS